MEDSPVHLDILTRQDMSCSLIALLACSDHTWAYTSTWHMVVRTILPTISRTCDHMMSSPARSSG